MAACDCLPYQDGGPCPSCLSESEIARLRDRVVELEGALKGVADFWPNNANSLIPPCWCGTDDYPDKHLMCCDTARRVLGERGGQVTARMEEVPRPYDMSIHSNPDAGAWAAFFVKTWREVHPDQPVPDEGWMLGWFANAMMAMHDAGPNVAEIARLTQALAKAREEVERLNQEEFRRRTSGASADPIRIALAERSDKWQTRALAAERARDEALREVASLEESVAAFEERDRWPKCACSYDKPTDVCATHSPRLARVVAERDEALAALRGVADFRPLPSQPESLWCWCGFDAMPKTHFPFCLAARRALAASTGEGSK